jgi:hypothetical protein
MNRLPWSIALLFLFAVSHAVDDKSAKAADPREALQPFNDLIGGWKGSGEPEGSVQERQRGFWRETVNWSWKFKEDDAWLTVAFGKGKHFKNGELRHLPDKGRYRLKVTTADNKELAFEGVLKGRTLTLERFDDDKKETQRLSIDMVQDIRFVYRYEVKPQGRTLFTKVYRVGATKEGESLAGPGEKKPECVVSGGLGTMTVSHKGQTYYVCCTGCRDAFLDNPEKYIKEFMEKKAKGK